MLMDLFLGLTSFNLLTPRALIHAKSKLLIAPVDVAQLTTLSSPAYRALEDTALHPHLLSSTRYLTTC